MLHLRKTVLATALTMTTALAACWGRVRDVLHRQLAEDATRPTFRGGRR